VSLNFEFRLAIYELNKAVKTKYHQKYGKIKKNRCHMTMLKPSKYHLVSVPKWPLELGDGVSEQELTKNVSKRKRKIKMHLGPHPSAINALGPVAARHVP
jgi:hypothetical protein